MNLQYFALTKLIQETIITGYQKDKFRQNKNDMDVLFP